MTRSVERMQQVDFSVTYYVTRRTFLVRKGTVKTMADLSAQKIGATTNSTAVRNVKKAPPDSIVVRFNGYDQAPDQRVMPLNVITIYV